MHQQSITQGVAYNTTQLPHVQTIEQPPSASPIPSSSTLSSIKRWSQSTSTSLDEQQHQSKGKVSPVISSFQSQQILDPSVQVIEEKSSCSSSQNSTLEMNVLVRREIDNLSEHQPLNQYYNMQAQQNRTIDAFPKQFSPPQEHQLQHKGTPETSHSDSPPSPVNEGSKEVPAQSPTINSNCQHKHQNKFQSSEEIEMKERHPQPTEPKKGIYYKNRTRLVQWLRSECAKFDLSHDAFAMSLFMMDSYFKSSSFSSTEFLHIALCMMVIASKMNQTKILYTARMAKKSKVPVEKMMEREVQLLLWFKFKTNALNFSKILTEYIVRWETSAKNKNINLHFHDNNLQSFLLFQELFYICFCQIRYNRELLVSTLKIIFQNFISKKTGGCEIALGIVDEIFQEDNIFASAEYEHVFECLQQGSKEHVIYISEMKKSIIQWSQDFKLLKEDLRLKYQTLKEEGKTHSQIMTIQF